MKMPAELYDDLFLAIRPHIADRGDTVRRRWDTLWRAVDAGSFDIARCYKAGLDDAHIDTALRRIFAKS